MGNTEQVLTDAELREVIDDAFARGAVAALMVAAGRLRNLADDCEMVEWRNALTHAAMVVERETDGLR